MRVKGLDAALSLTSSCQHSLEQTESGNREQSQLEPHLENFISITDQTAKRSRHEERVKMAGLFGYLIRQTVPYHRIPSLSM